MNDFNALSDRLRSFVDRIEKLEEDKAAVAEQIKEVFQEAKSEGFDIKVLRQVIRLIRQDADQRHEQESIKDLYLRALGVEPYADK